LIEKGARFKHLGGNVSLTSPEYSEDLAVKILRAR
jgi:hypothetical protein